MEEKEKEGMLIFKDKQARLILKLADGKREWYLSELAKSAEVTYIHTTRFITRCEALGLVESEKHGKIKRVFLTEKGRGVAQDIQSILNKMNQNPAPPPAPETA